MKLRVLVEQVADPGNGTYAEFSPNNEIGIVLLGGAIDTVPLIFRRARIDDNSVDVSFFQPVGTEKLSRSRNTIMTRQPGKSRTYTLVNPGDFVSARVGNLKYTFEAN